MTDTGDPPVVSAEPGLVAIAGQILLDPAAVGESVARRPMDGRVLGAFLLILAIAVGAGLLTLPQLGKMVREQSRERFAGMPAEQRASAEEFMEGRLMKAMLVVPMAGVVVIGVPLLAFLLYLGQLVMGGRATYGMVLSVTVFACLISIGLQSIVRTALVLAKDSFTDVSTGLGILVADRPLADPLRSVLDALDPFVLGATVCGGIALGPVSRLRTGTTVGISLLVWLLITGPATLLRMFRG